MECYAGFTLPSEPPPQPSTMNILEFYSGDNADLSPKTITQLWHHTDYVKPVCRAWLSGILLAHDV